MSDAWSAPNDPINWPLRPLNMGMIRDVASGQIPDHGMVNLQNFWADKAGLRRRNGYVSYSGGNHFHYYPSGMHLVWKTDGTQITTMLTDGVLYKVSFSTGYTEVLNSTTGDATAKVNVTGSAVTEHTANCKFVTNQVLPGDIFRCEGEEARIASVDSETALTLETAFVGTPHDKTYVIAKAFNRNLPYLADACVARGVLVIADGNVVSPRYRAMYKYDPGADTLGKLTTSSAHMINSGVEFAAGCVAFFADRLFCADTYEEPDDHFQFQRVRWSTLDDIDDFSDPVAYYDIPYSASRIMRLVPLGNYLAAYFEDSIFIGTPTNYPDLPVRFQQTETGNVGLVGKKAVCQAVGGHFFVGQDDFYFLNQSGTAEPFGAPIVRQALRSCLYPTRVFAVNDPQNFRVLFGIPQGSQQMAHIWSFDYRTKGWSYEPTNTWMIANPAVQATVTIDDLTMDIDEIDLTYPSIDAITSIAGQKAVYIEKDLILYKQDKGGTQDFGTTYVPGIIETKDYDFDKPDDLKTFLRLSVKIDFDTALTAGVLFTVAVSSNRGRVWRTVGDLNIPVGADEGYVNFLLTASTVRFRLTCNSVVDPFTVSEMVVRMRLKDREATVGTQSGP